jgi:hypothetical protein
MDITSTDTALTFQIVNYSADRTRPTTDHVYIFGADEHTPADVIVRAGIEGISRAEHGRPEFWVYGRDQSQLVTYGCRVGERIELWRGNCEAPWHVALLDRRVGDDGRTECGDNLRPGARRLCGGCAQSWQSGQPEPRGCGEVLERHDVRGAAS